MQLLHPACAGAADSGDVWVSVKPNPNGGTEINLQSDVLLRYGRSIRQSITDVLARLDVSDVLLEIVDKGALDYVIRARLVCALCRAADVHFDWEKEKAVQRTAPAERPLRSSMYAGGTSPSKLLQAQFYQEDSLIYDLEDAVSAEEKDAARLLIYYLLTSQRPRDKVAAVRVNGIYSEEFDEDLEAMVLAQPDVIRIPKVESGEEVRAVDEKISKIEERTGLEPGSTRLCCLIESYRGILNAREIASASPRINALCLGAEDYALSLGGIRTKAGWELFYARNALVLACREAGISAYDSVFADIRDEEGLQKELELARTLGFDGKSCVHPRQVAPINACFSPSEKEIRYAQRVLAAMEKAEGVCTLDGAMLDKPMEIRAKNTLARAKAAGLLTGEDETC